MQDYVCLHDRHSDWVTKTQHIEELGLITAGMDANIFIFDVNREGVMHHVRHSRPSPAVLSRYAAFRPLRPSCPRVANGLTTASCLCAAFWAHQSHSLDPELHRPLSILCRFGLWCLRRQTSSEFAPACACQGRIC